MNNHTIRLGATVRHVEGGRTGTVIGHVLADKGRWLHLVQAKAGRDTIRVWLGRSVLVEVSD
ncbi:MAG: hypothetical protein ACTHLT_05460 [Devosia sp.]